MNKRSYLVQEQDLRDLIYRHFADVVATGPVAHRTPTGGGADIFFKGRHRFDVCMDDLEHAPGAMDYFSTFTSEGIKTFLPGYMTMILQTHPDRLGFIRDSVALALTYKPSWNSFFNEAGFLEMVESFNSTQKEIIARFLKHQIAHCGTLELPSPHEDAIARAAFDSYWYQFLPADTDGKDIR